MHEARYYTKLPGERIRCELCPHRCILSDSKTGVCKVRTNHHGSLYSDNYGRLVSVSMDPVEKKPLYHFFPGEKILSIGSVGCNMHCRNCQNEQISQCIGIRPEQLQAYSVRDITGRLEAADVQLLAFTYNEPVVWFEYMYDVALAAREAGKTCVMVTNGYICQEPLKEILPLISAFNVDLKSYSDAFYRKVTGAKLQPVMETLETVKASGKHLEITYLVIPGMNDDPEEFGKLVEKIGTELGKEQVLHLSRYFPHYRMDLPPTPLSTLEALMQIAHEKFDYVYTGNTGPEFDSNTYCPKCGSLLIERNYYNTRIVGMTGAYCDHCQSIINGKFRES